MKVKNANTLEVIEIKTEQEVLEITPKEMAIMLVASPEFDGKISTLAERVGVSAATASKWLKDKEFIAEVDHNIQAMTATKSARIWKALMERAETGDPAAIKLYFEMTNKYKARIEVTNGDAYNQFTEDKIRDEIRRLTEEVKLT